MKRFATKAMRRAGSPGMPVGLLPLAFGLLLGSPVSAQSLYRPQPNQAAANLPDKVIQNVRLDQKLDAQVPLDTPFREESGKPVTLGQYFGQKPVMLMLIQYRCRMLCSEEMNALMASLKEMKFTPGKEFNLVVATIDHREQPDLALDKKMGYLKAYGRPEAAAGWHFLTGTKESIHRLADSVGFHFEYDPKTDQFAHPDGVILLTPQGKVARYFFRLEYPASGLRLGLVEAAHGKIGTPLDALALLCYHYNPVTGKYNIEALAVLRLCAIATVILLALGVVSMKRWEKRNRWKTDQSVAGAKFDLLTLED